jgi:hypothetical protein
MKIFTLSNETEKNLPLAIIETHRPEYLVPWADQTAATRLLLQPLASGDTSEIFRSRLGAGELPPELAVLVIRKAEGNPLFAGPIWPKRIVCVDSSHTVPSGHFWEECKTENCKKCLILLVKARDLKLATPSRLMSPWTNLHAFGGWKLMQRSQRPILVWTSMRSRVVLR